MALFAVTYVYAPELKDRREENKPVHRKWLSEQVDAGRILTVGPFPDGGGALLVVAADSDRDARELVAADPHALEGLIAETGVREWTPVFGLMAGD